VLSYGYFVKQDSKKILKNFFKRYFRLEFPVLFSVLVAFIFLKAKLLSNIELASFTKSYELLQKIWGFEPNLTAAFKQGIYRVFLSGETYYNPVLWTMKIELLGSFLVYGILLIFGGRKSRYLIYGFSIIPLYLLRIPVAYYAFILGIMISDSMNQKRGFFIKGSIMPYLAMVLGLFLYLFPEHHTYALFKYMHLTELFGLHQIFGAFFVVLSLASSRRLQTVFSLKSMTFLGKISFSMYVIHLLIVCSFSSSFFILLSKHFSYNSSFMLMFFPSMLLILLSAALIYTIADRPGIIISNVIADNIYELITKVKLMSLTVLRKFKEIRVLK